MNRNFHLSTKLIDRMCWFVFHILIYIFWNKLYRISLDQTNIESSFACAVHIKSITHKNFEIKFMICDTYAYLNTGPSIGCAFALRKYFHLS